jgi:cytochrome c2
LNPSLGFEVAIDIAIRIGTVCLGALAASCAPAHAPSGIGDPHLGAQIVEREACGSCHVIPGKADGFGVVGPSLKGIGRRAVIAGFLPNRPDEMVRWLRSPQAILPRSTMPDMGLTDKQARNIAAYLYSLR